MESTSMRAGILLLFFVSALILSGCGSAESRKEKYLSQAKTFMAEKNWPKARVALRNVLKLDPRDADAYFLFARVEEKEKNWRNAFGDYLKVVELKPDHREAWIKVGRYYLAAGDLDKAKHAADVVLARYPDDPSAETINAALWIKKGNTGKALALMEKSVARHPAETDAVTLLSSLYGDRNRWSEAELVLDRALRERPDDVVLLNNLAAVYVRREKFDEAEKTYLRIVEAEPEEFSHRAGLANYYDFRREIGKAEAALREAVRRNSDDEQRWLILAQYVAAHKNIQEGEEVLLSAKKSMPDSMKIRFVLGRFYEGIRQPRKARAIYEEIVDEDKKSPSGLDARVSLAALDLAEGKQETAEEEIRKVLEENPKSVSALYLQGNISLSRGEGKESVQSFWSLLRDQPDRADVHVRLAQSYLLLGQKELARESLMKGLSIDPRQLEGRRVQAVLAAMEDRRSEAVSGLKALLKEFPGDLETREQLIRIQAAGGDWDGAEKALAEMKEKIRNAGTDTYDQEMTEGALSEARRQWPRAEESYRRSLEIRSQTPEPLFSLVRVLLIQKKSGPAEDLLRQRLQVRSKDAYLHGLLGEVLLSRGDSAGGMRELEEAIRLKPEWTAPWTDLAQWRLAEKDPEKAVDILEKGVQANPDADDLRLLLAMTLGEAGRTDPAIQMYEAVLQGNPNAFLAANNMAVLLVEKKGDPVSLQRAFKVTEDFEKKASNPLFLDTRGWLLLKMGRHEEALKILRTAVDREPRHPELNYHLGMAFYKTGKMAEARNYLTRALGFDVPFNGREEARALLKQIG